MKNYLKKLLQKEIDCNHNWLITDEETFDPRKRGIQCSKCSRHSVAILGGGGPISVYHQDELGEYVKYEQ